MSLTIDDSLALADVALTIAHEPASNGRDVVQVTWTAPPGVTCVQINQRVASEAGYPAIASAAIVAAARGAALQPSGPSGRFCFLIVPVGAQRRGPHSEECLNVARPAPPPVELSDPGTAKSAEADAPSSAGLLLLFLTGLGAGAGLGLLALRTWRGRRQT